MSDDGLDSDEIILEEKYKIKTRYMQIYHFSVSFKLVLTL